MVLVLPTSLSFEVFIFPGFPSNISSTRYDCIELLHNYMAFTTRNLDTHPTNAKMFPLMGLTIDVEAA